MSGVRSWKMRIFLVWTLFSGGWAVTGPTHVMAKQGSSLAVSCSYKPGYELYSKYWCRPSFLWFCFTYIAHTNGSEVTVTQDGVSIRDNHMARSFTVTLSGVTPRDAGWYSCGLSKTLWFNLWHNIEVMVSAAISTTSEGSNMSPLVTNFLGPTDSEEPPVLSPLSVTHLLLFLSAKASVALALVCGAAWVRSRCRSRDRENLQLFEMTGSTRAPGCPPAPTTSEPQERPPAPLPPTLPALCSPSQLPCTRSCSALGASPPVKPWPLLAAPALERGSLGVQRASVC
ncbi:CMRF35-like molecule 1 [Strix aluco]|uniref:CMRF35-like molecule 1 n=1 Tax=Strix aluco TaxID=111821 RepID=UPI003DA3537B